MSHRSGISTPSSRALAVSDIQFPHFVSETESVDLPCSRTRLPRQGLHACDTAVVLAAAGGHPRKHLEGDVRLTQTRRVFDWDCERVTRSAIEGAHVGVGTWSDSGSNLSVGKFRPVPGSGEAETAVCSVPSLTPEFLKTQSVHILLLQQPTR